MNFQIQLEMWCALSSVPWMAVPTVSLFMLEIKGYSKLYDDYQQNGGIAFMIFSFFAFLMFTVRLDHSSIILQSSFHQSQCNYVR